MHQFCIEMNGMDRNVKLHYEMWKETINQIGTERKIMDHNMEIHYVNWLKEMDMLVI